LLGITSFPDPNHMVVNTLCVHIYIYIHCVPITIILLVISQSKRKVWGWFHIPRDDEVNNHVHNLTKTIAHMYLFQKATTNRRMNVE
jgi:hypothetical protein